MKVSKPLGGELEKHIQRPGMCLFSKVLQPRLGEPMSQMTLEFSIEEPHPVTKVLTVMESL